MSNKFSTTARRLGFCAAPLVLMWSIATGPAHAQDAAAPAQTQSQTQNEPNFSEAQIEQFVAPIALYPDPLLTQILMASTYPLEVVEAARWSRDNPAVKGQALEDAMQAQPWDPSIKALTALPQTLEMMNDKLDWTQQLGDAFLAQQQDVLAAVQKLRAEAQAAGNLQSRPQQTVTTAPPPAGTMVAAGPQPIVIEPVNPDVYDVPIYNPAVVYGTWDYPAYQPFYWSPPGYVAGNVLSFAAGVAVGAAIWGGCNWWQHNVIINVNRYNVFNRTNINVTNNIWVHNPAHRGNVPYRNAAVAERFGRGNEAAAREALRDRPEQSDMFKRAPGPQTDPGSRDRADAPHDDAGRDHVDAQRPDAPRRLEGNAGDDAARAAPDRRDAGFRPDGGDRKMDGAVMPDRPRRGAGNGGMRPQRMRSFRPQQRAGGFRDHFAFHRR
jgi:Protein of unknown function (DUF3300)